MDAPSDTSIVRNLKEKRAETVARIVHQHAGDLLRAALGLGLAPADAEELVQAVFVAFLDGAGRFEGRSSVKTYLFGILYRKAMEQGRLKSRELATDPADAVFESRFNVWGHWSSGPKGPDAETDLKEISSLIAQCLDGLPSSQRAAFQLKEIDHQSNAEIRNVLGVADTHLRVLLFRARNHLRDCIEKKWKE